MPRAAAPLAWLAFLLLAACGGGGRNDPPEQQAPSVNDGFVGAAVLPGAHLGRIAEVENNDTLDRPQRLAPVGPRSVFELVGTVGVTADAWGRQDATDHVQVTTLGAQALRIDLTFDVVDHAGLGPNELTMSWLEAGTGALLDEATSATGTISLDVATGNQFPRVLRISVGSGHTPYLARFTLTDPPAAPKPGATTWVPRGLSGPSKALAPASASLANVRGIVAGQRCAHDHVLARFAPGVDIDALLASLGCERGRRLGGGGYCVCFPPDEDAPEVFVHNMVARLRDTPGVVWADIDAVVHALGEPADPLYPEQWNLRLVGTTDAWDLTTGAGNVVVAVIDTGIIPHAELNGRIVPGYDFISDAGIAGDGTGRDGDPTDMGDGLMPGGTDTWHGTHVAGVIVAAQGNGAGLSGLAPACSVMPLRSIGRGGGLVSDTADAVLFAAGLLTVDGRRIDPPVAAINLSLGAPDDIDVLREACDRAAGAGVLVVAAAGNSGAQGVLYPAAYANVMAVAAVDPTLRATGYSSFGPQVEIAAPGGSYGIDVAGDGWTDAILSLWRDDTMWSAQASAARFAGTSQAAPHVAAAAALLRARAPSTPMATIRGHLVASAQDLAAPGHDAATGWGLLRVDRAMRRLDFDNGISDARAPRLLLPWQSVRLEGLQDEVDVPLLNDGGGRLELGALPTWTLDGAPWLSASLVPPASLPPDISHDVLRIRANRTLLPAGNWFSGYVALRDTGGTVRGRVLVSVGRDAWGRVGADLRLAAHRIQGGTSSVPRAVRVTADTSYRFWVRDLPAGIYLLQCGEDLDDDGFFCEPGDWCGWYGGTSEASAAPLTYSPTEVAQTDLGIVLQPPP